MRLELDGTGERNRIVLEDDGVGFDATTDRRTTDGRDAAGRDSRTWVCSMSGSGWNGWVVSS